MRSKTIMAAGSIALFLPSSMLVMTGDLAQDSFGEPGRASGKPNPLKNVYFGEQNLHTSASPDAFVTVIGKRTTGFDADGNLLSFSA